MADSNNKTNFGNTNIRQNQASARAHTLRNFISKITVGELDNQPKHEYTFIHEYEFMVSFSLANGISFTGIKKIIEAKWENHEKTDVKSIKSDNKDTKLSFSRPPDYIEKFLDSSFQEQNWDFYLKSIDLPNITYGSGRAESLDDGNNVSYSPGFDHTLISNGAVTTDEKEITCIFYDSELSFVDGFIIPWMQDVANPRATLYQTIDSNNKFVFNGSAKFNYYGTIIIFQISSVTGSIVREWRIRNARPKIVNTPDFDKEKGNEIMTREVVFAFDRLEYFNYEMGNKVKTLKEKELEKKKKLLDAKKTAAANKIKDDLLAQDDARKAKAGKLSKDDEARIAKRKKEAKEKEKAAQAAKQKEKEDRKKAEELAKQKEKEDMIKATNSMRQNSTVSSSTKNVQTKEVTWWDRNNPF